MIYDLHNVLDCERFKARCNKLYAAKAVVEFSEKKVRSVAQNSYLHLILAWHAIESGNTVEWVKQRYFKLLVNPEIFVAERQDKHLGEVKYLLSTASISKEQMTTAIDKFKIWSAHNGIYLPDADNGEFLAAIQVEQSRQAKWL